MLKPTRNTNLKSKREKEIGSEGEGVMEGFYKHKMSETLKENRENPQSLNNNGQETPTISPYEQSREERIKENLQRMQKLGIFDISLKLKSTVHPKRTTKHTLSDSPRSTPVLPSEPLRRSSRLQNATPVSYSKAVISKKGKGLEDKDVKLQEGSKPEVYTEEHEKLLGNTERSWTFFVDGYGEDGKRIYDPVKGKTCHQCRQKTLGHRTHCSRCNMVQGQFCGDCLYMRYGEHVLEAMENPNWICPVCRGICNCSLCRQAKGWCPTGILYKKISSLGFKSVAHYLIQTRRAQTTLEKSPDTFNQASAKRSLSFADREAFLKDSPKVNENQLVTLKPQSEDRKDDDNLNIEKETNMLGYSYPSTNHQTSTKRSLHFSNVEEGSQNMDSIKVDLKVQNHFELQPQLEASSQNMKLPLANEKRLDLKQAVSNIEESEMHVTDDRQGEREKRLHYTHKEHNDSDVALEGCQNYKKKRAAIDPIQDSIAGRLRLRRRLDNDHDDMQAVSNILSDKEKEMAITDDELSHRTSDGTTKLVGEPAVATEPDQDSIARRLRSRNKTT